MSGVLVDATIHAAERVAAVLDDAGVPSLVIGALALAAHHHPRATTDLDLAIATHPKRLKDIAAALRAAGFDDVELRSPDADDPLGGVLDVRVPGAQLIQVVNFDNAPAGGFPRLVTDALADALPLPGTKLRVVDLSGLIAFKLYAGGAKSTLDVLELLAKNDVDRDALSRRCAALGLGAPLGRVLALTSTLG